MSEKEVVKVDISEYTKHNYQVAESYKTLRTNIEFCGKDVKVISITSCIPNEGKSTVALNLASSLADSGKKVFFMDADLRKSVLISRLKLSGKVEGLTNYLVGQCEFNDIVCTTSNPRLHMVFAGAVPPNPAEILGSKAFGQLVDVLRESYDYIIIDTPPIGSVIDGAVVAKVVDGIAIVVTANEVSYKFVKKVIDQLSKAGSRILGVILNKVDMSVNSYYGKYYGNYYGKYYGNDLGKDNK